MSLRKNQAPIVEAEEVKRAWEQGKEGFVKYGVEGGAHYAITRILVENSSQIQQILFPREQKPFYDSSTNGKGAELIAKTYGLPKSNLERVLRVLGVPRGQIQEVEDGIRKRRNQYNWW